MQTRPIDPRDVDGEVEATVYRVYFSDSETSEREVRVTEARNVVEVIEWAKSDARSTPFKVYCEHPSAFNRGKVTLDLLFSR